MKIGNVIKDPEGSLWIVNGVFHDIIMAVSFDSQNVSACAMREDHTQSRACYCDDRECQSCHGTGSYLVNVKGWDRSEVLAASVKDFILNGVKKIWNLS